MLAALKAIQTELNAIQMEVVTLRTKVYQKNSTTKVCHSANATMPGQGDQGRNRNHNDGKYPLLCQKCQETNQVNYPHCFKCGGRNHIARYC